MSFNLQTDDAISATPQPVKDQEGNSSPLVLSSDKIGIGASNPTQQLTLGAGNMMLPAPKGAVDGNLYFGGTTDTGQIGMRLFGGKINDVFQSGFIDVRAGTMGDGLRFRVDTFLAGTERMRITAAGNVGINTPAPQEKLEVNGNVLVTGNLSVQGISFLSLLQRIQQLEQKLGASPGRTITVSKQGVGASAVFTVEGIGFKPNSLVVIRATSPQLQQVQFTQTAGRDGKFKTSQSIRCLSGLKITFTAFEDNNPAGTLANVVETTCP